MLDCKISLCFPELDLDFSCFFGVAAIFVELFNKDTNYIESSLHGKQIGLTLTKVYLLL